MYFRPTYDVPDMIKLRFTLSGNGTIFNNVNKQQYTFNANQQNIIYMPDLDGTGQYDTLPELPLFEVHFAKEKFLQLAEHSTKALQVLADDADTGRYTQLSEHNLPISWAMQHCIRDILDCDYPEGLKRMFIESKCIELLVLQAEAFERAISQKNLRLYILLTIGNAFIMRGITSLPISTSHHRLLNWLNYVALTNLSLNRVLKDYLITVYSVT